MDMDNLRFLPLPSDKVHALRKGGKDAYNSLPELTESNGHGNPFRHCLDYVPTGAGMLILAYRPFPEFQPYAETGPIFLCADNCQAWSGHGMPPILQSRPNYLLKGYTAEYRIVYGSGKIIDKEDVAKYADSLLRRDEISFVDVRSATNNCFQLRIALAEDEKRFHF